MSQQHQDDHAGHALAAAAALAARVSRSELLLSGRRASDLLQSLAEGFGARFGGCRFALWGADEFDGRPRWLCSSDASSATRARWDELAAMAEDCRSSGERRGDPNDPLVIALPMPIGKAGAAALVCLLGRLAPGGDTWLADAARLLSQRLPPALELERLYEAMRQLAEAERVQRALYSIADLAGSTRDMDEVLAGLHAIVAELTYAENFFIAMLDEERQLYFPYFRDSDDPEPPDPGERWALDEYGGSLTAYVLTHGEALMGPSLDLAARFGAVGGYGPQSIDWLGVPMKRGSEVIGAVVVQSYDESHRYDARDRALLTFVAQHIATAIERKQAHDQLESRVAERTEALRRTNLVLQAEVEERQRGERLQAALFRIAELGSTSGSVEEFYAAVHRVVGELLYAGNFYIALLSDSGREISFPYSVDEFDISRAARSLGRGLTEYVMRSGLPLLADRNTIARLNAEGEVVSHGARATVWLGVPLICDEVTVGVLAVQSYDEAHRYSRRDQELLTFVSYHIANALMRKQAAESLKAAYAELEQRVAERTQELFEANRDLREQISERERAERQLKHDALHDALTGLPNRAHLLNGLADALSRYARWPQRRFAVLFLDLDRFKVINDSVGHLVGDELLKEVARRIAATLHGWGMVARLGGDEFAVLLEPMEQESDAADMAQRIIDALDEPVRVGGKDLYSSTSIGIAYAQPHYRTPEELLRDADVALYRAKAKGRRRFELFDETLRQEALAQLEMEGALRRAILRGEFEPHFQPIVSLSHGGVVGYEALLRWRRPQGLVLAPGEFLSLAEDSGLAEAIDWQVFELAFAQAHALLGDAGFISINVGGRHFRSPTFVAELTQLMQRYELPPRQLRIEVTERTLLEDPDEVRRMMAELAQAGVSLALDDFGTGYSSLSYLHQFPLHAIKIDRSFVSALVPQVTGNASAVLRAICSLGHSLGMEVIAEGIETDEQKQALVEMGCDFGQGFLLAHPATAASLIGARGTPRRELVGAR